MPSFEFKALGTAWSITIDLPLGEEVPQAFWQTIVTRTADFEQRFSRFIPTSEVNAFRAAAPGEYAISTELKTLLVATDQLRQLTGGAYDPAVGTLMEAAGYNAQYQLQPNSEEVNTWQLPVWSLEPKTQMLQINGPVVFDLGGIGKGYWIDQVSHYLLEQGYAHHLVEGGGDMMATTKLSGDSWRVALEWPGQPDTALGVVDLTNQGLAASDTFRRRWGNWHHLIDVKAKQPVADLLGCVTIAPTAWQADQLTSALALTAPEGYPGLAQQLGGEYIVLLKNGQALVSPQWSGELF